jgi:molecular chaperone GrpE (heat shock protein)
LKGKHHPTFELIFEIMHIKSVIIGFLLLLFGSGALWWTVSERRREHKEAEFYRSKYASETSEYIQQYEQWLKLSPEERAEIPLGLDVNGHVKTQAQLQHEQQERLKADLDKLAAGEMTVYPFADDFYGENWRQELEEYKKQKEVSEFVLTGSIMCTAVGGIIVGWFLLLNIARIIIKIMRGFKYLLCRIFHRQIQTEDEQQIETDEQEKEPEKEEKPPSKEGQTQNISKVLVNSGWQYSDSLPGQSQKIGQKKRVPLKSKASVENKNEEISKESSETNVSHKAQKQDQACNVEKKAKSKDKPKNITITPDDSDQLNPLDDTLKDLTQQVSAIREYAAHQQNRLEKLQDGYDWNIIKSFCLRIIRCIDNVESRIKQFDEQECDVTHLEEIRDELVFALESSGVEQYEPEINSEYRGQEKFAEAVKERIRSKNPGQKGKIEKVIRPGYQCFIDEENVRIVRPAQVRLYL